MRIFSMLVLAFCCLGCGGEESSSPDAVVPSTPVIDVEPDFTEE